MSGGLDIEDVLADKILRHHIASEANVPRDVLDRVLDALTPHVAAVLHEQIAAAQAEAWERGHEVCEWPGCAKNHDNPYRAAQVASGEGS